MSTLNVVGTYDPLTTRLEVDEYVPFDFRAHEGVWPSPFYYFIGDPNVCYFELKLDKDSGKLLQCILINYQKSVIEKNDEENRTTTSSRGVPIFDAKGLIGNRYDSTTNFVLRRGQNKYVVELDHFASPDHRVIAGRTVFCIKNDRLCAIEFCDLLPHEIALLRGIGI